jgi:predicted nucleic acid-binding protein
VRKAVLVDTGPLVAVLSQSDAHHLRCLEKIRELDPPLLTCWLVVTEAAWLLREYPDAISRLLGSFESGFLRLAVLDESDVAEIAAILAKYRNIGAQLADAALIHLANRNSIETVFTLDRLDFQIFRLKGGKRLRVIP